MTRRARSRAALSGLPWVAAALALVALVASLAPGVDTLLQYDRVRFVAGESWRALTGQLVHWSPRMAVLDIGAVLLLGAWLERRSRRLFVATATSALLAVGLGVHLAAPGIQLYRGASGLATALFVGVLLAARERRATGASAIAVTVLALLALKLGVEVATGAALAAGPLPAGVQVLPLAHLLGALAGLAVATACKPPRIERSCSASVV